MRLRGYIHAIVGLWIISMVIACMSSCSMIWSDEEQIPQCNIQQTVTLNLTIIHPDAGIPTRADLEYDDLEYTRNEAAVKNLSIFIVDLNTDGSENYSEVDYSSTEIDPAEFNEGIYSIRQTFKVKVGAKHIYVGANMKEEHIQAFVGNKPLSLVGDGPAVNMVMTPDPRFSGEGTDILMFGKLKNLNGSDRIEIYEGAEEFDVSGTMERLTAKVLLTCDEGEPGLVRTGGRGWVETDKIRYTLNATNMHTFINRHADNANSVNTDPNGLLSSYITTDADGRFIPGEGHDLQFEYWNTEDIRSRLFNERYSAKPLKYDPSKVGEGNSEDHYTEGIYCLENTAYNDMGLSGATLDKAAMVATTHVVMVVRFIPKFVYTYQDVVNETGPTAMSWDTVLSDYLVATDDGHEVGTYWTRTDADGNVHYYGQYSKNQYIAKYGAMESDFTCYEGGWSYFTTFIDGNTPGDSDQLTYDGLDSWGVQRNHYYILTVDHISNPGSPIPDGNFIKVNSQTTEWFTRGSQEVIIKPKGN